MTAGIEAGYLVARPKAGGIERALFPRRVHMWGKHDCLASTVPVMRDSAFRIEMTAGCRDCDPIPKVADAGAILVENGERVQIMHNGLRVVADGYYGTWMSEIIRRLCGHHEPQEELVFDAILRLLPERATMVELGGFWSYYTLWFLHHCGNRRAYVIEPDPNHIVIGRRNAALNRADISFVQAFIGRETTPDQLFTTETAGTIRLPMINVADFIAERRLETVNILHSDTQGAEIDLIATCSELFRAGRIQFLVLSTHAEAIASDPLIHQRCLQMIEELGGRVLAEHDIHESFSGDGLIAAYFGKEPLNWPSLALSYNRYSKSLFRNPLYDLALSRKEVARLKVEQHQRAMLDLFDRRMKSYDS